jgi:hypothetical protein
MGRVSGTVFTSEGRPAAGASISVMTVTGNGMSSYSAGSVSPDGSFTVSGIAPGEHTLQIRQNVAGSLGEFASAPVVVGSTDVTGVQITMAPGAMVTGRLVWEGNSPRAAGQVPLRVSAQQADPERRFLFGPTDPLANGTPDDEGHFKLGGVSGTVFFSAPAPPNWAIKSVTLDGEDITDVPLDMAGRTAISDLTITLTDKLASVAGQVTDARNSPVTDYVVVLLPADEKPPLPTTPAAIRPAACGPAATWLPRSRLWNKAASSRPNSSSSSAAAPASSP